MSLLFDPSTRSVDVYSAGAGDQTGPVKPGLLARAAPRQLSADLQREAPPAPHELLRSWAINPALLSVIDADGRFQATNPAWEVALGWSEAEMRRTRLSDLIHPDDLAASLAAFDGMVRAQPMLNLENRCACKAGGWRWMSWVGAAEGDRSYCSARGMGDANARGSTFQSLADELRQARKMETVGQLAGGIAHDFNNMLTGVVGALDIARRRLAQGRYEEVERFIDIARQSGERAAALTRRLLSFSRPQAFAVTLLDPNDVAVGLEELVRRTLGDEIRLNLFLANDVWNVEVDVSQFENALLNLAINARDAMPNGGVLTIATANATLRGDASSHPAELPPGDYAAIRVQDTGLGMSDAVIDRAFDPFFTTKPIGKGTGLGLSMIRAFAQQARGHVCIKSQVGVGTTITILLPRVACEPDDLRRTPPRGGRLFTAPDQILALDDEPTI